MNRGAAISVVLATHNGARYLPEQLRSLAWQQKLPAELIVSDDQSVDATHQIVRCFAADAAFPVRLTINPSRLGVSGNFESGIRAAGGEIIATCDQDDVWYPEKLAEMERAFASPTAPDLVFCNADAVDANLNPLGYSLWDSVDFGSAARAFARRRGLFDLLVKYNVVTGAAMAFRSAWRDRVLPIGDNWYHDGWIALIVAATGKCAWIEKPLLAYRQHGNQQVGAARKTLARQVATARRMNEDYFQQVAQKYERAIASLAGYPPPADHKRKLDLLRQKVIHCEAKALMRSQSGRLRRLPVIATELLRRRYGRVALGAKSAAADLLL